MATKWMLVRKTGKREWQAIWMEDDQGIKVHGGKNSNKAEVEAARDRLKSMCPTEKYAVVEVTEG